MVRTLIAIPTNDKRWLENYSRRHRVSSSEVVRRAIKEYRRSAAKTHLARILEETAGSWRSIEGDSQDYVDALRSGWEHE